MTHWALLSYTLDAVPTQVTITAITSTPAHLYAHYTTIEPVRTLLPRIRRGLTILCYPHWTYNSQGYIEQTEPGLTTTHTFVFSPWLHCVTRWILFSAQTDLTIKASNSPIMCYHNIKESKMKSLYAIVNTVLNYSTLCLPGDIPYQVPPGKTFKLEKIIFPVYGLQACTPGYADDSVLDTPVPPTNPVWLFGKFVLVHDTVALIAAQNTLEVYAEIPQGKYPFIYLQNLTQVVVIFQGTEE